jgi:L-seryl-tRNA(Ser) seleniumtransferase
MFWSISAFGSVMGIIDPMEKDSAFLRKLPAVGTLLESPAGRSLEGDFGHGEAVWALRRALDTLRAERRGPTSPEAVADRARRLLAPPLRRVVNATGVLIHTHLGRTPLPDPGDLLTGYSNLEIDLANGDRGDRNHLAEALLRRLTGAEAALAVNNTAAAVMLALAAFAKGGEVLVSRGELVEIGGSFRVPEILEQSGCVLREVGTTNRTRTADYAAAVSDRTRGILKVHPSNFRVVGFTESPSPEELGALARERGLPFWVDQGCGWIRPVAGFDFPEEEPVPRLLEAGADLVFFSGDKLLGGPQAGLAVGRTAAVGAMRRHPLYRAVRPGKETFALLQATLAAHLGGQWERLPLWTMALTPVEELRKRARAVARRAQQVGLEVVDHPSRFGGGTTPLREFPSAALAWAPPSPAEAFGRLLSRQHPVLGIIQGDRLLFDLRTVLPEEDPILLEAFKDVAGSQ